MSQIDVLIVVDAEGALASKDLGSNVYLIDTNKHVGSGSEGQAELKTVCKDGQVINWRVAAVSPSSDVSITQFTGQMINDRFCIPSQVTTPDGIYWQGRVEAQGATGSQQYSVELSLDGQAMSFDPFLEIS
ncbi:alpha-pore-forming tripartite toxin MakABE regulator [Pseudomonas rubra]|uniref:Inclusion body family protein n=1 Tax=Pseudomonas rubra TaxID=2942627 RepID=A0ABT5PBM1_9PSED|nr:hypothetical protein [Pseudomonas rubra]MDD1015699.1 inclusion body family protein [Pseudomonas rubra]MDD1040321.1 inclusion body family protein [Pseudomonas rubra]MDD1153912.1 inclusion body family protein [Pseudomonas rubra]